MKTELLINRLKDLRDNGECISETAVLEQAIKTIEALKKIGEEIEELEWYGDKAFWDGVYAVSKIMDKHLAEVEA